MSEEFNDDLMHYGILRRSGRYPWGSGGNTSSTYQRSMKFYDIVNELKSPPNALSDKEIAEGFGMTIAQLRDTRTIAKEAIVLEQTNQAVTLRDKGTSIKAISERMGIPEATVRSRLKNSENMKRSMLLNTADTLRKNVDEHQIIDIGKGVNIEMNISPEKLRAATAVLHDEGYLTYSVPVRQPGTNQFTNQKVLVPPGTTYGEARRMSDRIHTIGDWTEDDGLTYFGIHTPLSVDSKRLKVNFAEDGGTDADGVIYIRPGVKDLDMGKNTYAQVRILVDNSHYIKGMAVLNSDMPPGIDLVFNTNKSRDVGKLGSLKPIEQDSDNPFGSVIKRQIVDIDPKTGNERVKSALNIVNEEGDWEDWRRSLPSQMLAKQPHSLIKSQLKVTREQVQSRIDEINQITNDVVRKKKLEDFADQIDADAVDLRAAAMPRQQTQVIIPVPKLAKHEIYAPNFETGEPVVLIRYPHGGKFEIPEVTVNNNNRTAKKLLGNATDAIGIHPSVAERLSGADFDGDTVIVIPNRQGKIKGSKSLGANAAKVYEDGLGSFDPKRKYGGYETITPARGKKGEPGYKPEVGNFPVMNNTGLEMGKITNLITDMSIQGASPEHIVRAVRHSMVVIDAEKHKLNYRQSEIDNGIAQLKELYQGSSKSGAKTLLSRATAKVEIPERKPRLMQRGGPVDPETGERRYEPTGRMRNAYDRRTRTYTDEKVPYTSREKRLALTNDAYNLVRDRNDPVERMYADHANEMKALANQTRLQALQIKPPKMNDRARKAKQVYRPEIEDLVSQLRAAQKQAPLARKADRIANAVIKAKRQEDPTLREDRDRLAKVERQAKAYARGRLGLSKPTITITDRAWDAIQSGGVSSSMLRDILRYADTKRIEELSIPKKNPVMTTAIAARAKAMLAAGATNAEVARSLGVAPSTLRAAALRGDL